MGIKEDRSARKRSAFSLTFGGLGLIAAAGLGVFYFSGTAPGQTKPQPATQSPTAVPVQISRVLSHDVPIERSGLGVVTPLTRVDVKVRIDGTIEHLNFAEGQDVRAGDAIASIDPKPYEVAVDQAQATYGKDLAQLNAATIDEARARKLTSNGTGTTQAADAAAAQVAIYQATLDGDKAAIEKAKLDLSYALVKAPISGRIGLKQTDEGAIVRASDTTGIVTITQMRPIAIDFTLTQDDLPDLVSGQAAGQLPVSVESRDGSKHLADGKLQVIDSQVDSTTGMVKLKAVFDNQNLVLWPGELISARVILRTNTNSTVVPSAAIQNGQSGQYVFVVKSDNTVATVPVKTGPVSGNLTTVAGLTVGDTVVTVGQSRLSDGSLVSGVNPAADKIASADKETAR